jgi:hypothetical protein
MTIAIGIASVLALLMCPMVVVWNFSLNTSDAAGNSWAAIYTVFGTLALWTMLGVVLLLVRLRGGTGGLPGWPAFGLLVLTCGAALAVTYLLDQREPLRWMLAIQILVPPLIVASIAWATIPSRIVWGLILILGLLPWTRLIGHQPWERKRGQAHAAERDEWQRRFDQLTPQSPVHDWMVFLNTRYTLYDEALKRIRALDHKQSDIERMLNSGDYLGFEALWNLELTPTPALFEGVRKFLRDQTTGLKPTPKRRRYYPELAIIANPWQTSLQWFAKNGCPMLDELNAFEATLRCYPDSEKEAALFLGAIREMKNLAPP